MNALDLIKLVRTNLSRTRFRALLSASGVLIGTAAVVILVSLANGLQSFTSKELTNIGPLNEVTVISFGGGGGSSGGMSMSIKIVGGSNSDMPKLTSKYLNTLSARDDVKAILPRVSLTPQATVKYKHYKASPVVYGIDMKTMSKFEPQMKSGALDTGQWEAVVGAKVGEIFSDPRRARNSRVEAIDLQGATLTLTVTHTTSDGKTSTRDVRVHVAGVLASRGGEYDFGIYMRMTDVQELNRWDTGKSSDPAREGYSQAIVLAKNAEYVEKIAKQLQDDGFAAFSSQQVLNQINQTFAILQAFVGGIGAITLAIAGTGIANTMITAIYERTREIGLMKALGASDGQVMSLFLAEAAGIGLLGGASGLLLGWTVSQAINIFAQKFYLPQLAARGGMATGDVIVTPLWVFVVAPLFAAGIGVLAGMYPARHAALLDPVVALRTE